MISGETPATLSLEKFIVPCLLSLSFGLLARAQLYRSAALPGTGIEDDEKLPAARQAEMDEDAAARRLDRLDDRARRQGDPPVAGRARGHVPGPRLGRLGR